MIWISHRGNINGPQPDRENTVAYITEALQCGFHVEIDVWYIDGIFYLGHDGPAHPITRYFLQNQQLWCHAKNIEALYEMLNMSRVRCFSHDNDDAVLTTDNYIWTFPGKKLTLKSIYVMPEKDIASEEEIIAKARLFKITGICSDYVQNLQEKYNDT